MKVVTGLVWLCLSVWVARADVVAPSPPVEVFAVAAGFPVSYSCAWNDNKCWLPELDADGAWCACQNDLQQWIKISSVGVEDWKGVITQGRNYYGQRVDEYYITYTLNGLSWMMLENGRIFKGNSDVATRVRNDFEAPVRARAIRLHPTKWNNHISMRVQGIISVASN